MKKNLWILLTLLILCLVSQAFAAPEIKYSEAKFDIFGVKFMKPEDWTADLTADKCVFTPPAVKDLEMVFLEIQSEYESDLEEFFKEYKEQFDEISKDDKSFKLISSQPFEVGNSIGAYYIRVQNSKKEFGHIIFINNKKRYVIALKTPMGQYEKWEPILKEAAGSIKFYKPKL